MKKLRDVTVKVGSGATPRGGKSVYVPEGVAFIRSQNILDFETSGEGMAYITEGAAEVLKGVSVRKNDVLVNITGDSVARVAMWRSDIEARVSQHVAIVRCDTSKVVPSYVQYWLLAQQQKSALLTLASAGASRPALTKRMLEEFPIEIPELPIQYGITEVLGALDDKIAANGAVVSSAETLRRTAWVRATRGAKLAPLSSFAQFVNGGAYTKGATGTGRVVIRIAELNSGISASTVYNDLVVPDRQVAHAGDLLMSWSGSLTAVRWYRDDAIVNQHIFKVIPRDNHPLWAVACAVETKLDEFREIAAGKATTMGHIKRADLDSPVAWPEVSDRLNGAGTALWVRALAAERENLRLAATRDELLPLLMSGKITIKDAEKTVEEVV